MADYNPMELMICTASRLLEDGATVGVGTGAPCATAMLAQTMHAPDLLIVFEAGGLPEHRCCDFLFCGIYSIHCLI